MYSSYTLIATFIALSTFYGAGNILTAQNVFTTHALLSLIGKFAYGNFALAVDFASKSWITFKRMESFLMTCEQNAEVNKTFMTGAKFSEAEGRKTTSINTQSKPGYAQKKLKSKTLDTENEPLVKSSLVNERLENDRSRLYSDNKKLRVLSDLSSVNHGGMRSPLKNINIELSENKLFVVTGPVGSGKSSLLQIIIGELPISEGKIFFDGQIAHVPQTPWLLSGTIRENILFGRKFDYQRYEEVVEACALNQDFKKFVKGDLTNIGERGISLSGGQKSRVALARAVYSEADVYLLDDPFSAVDTQVGKQLFEKCICQLLSHRPRVLVTHQVQFLKQADEIIVMNNGQISKRGNYSDLEASGEYFKFLNNPSKNEKGNDSFLAYEEGDCSEVLQDEESKERTKEDGLERMQEDRQTGTVSYKTYLAFFSAALPFCGLCLFFLLFVAPEGNQIHI